MKLLITVIVAFLGAYVGLKCKVPAGALVGAMLSTAIFNVIFGAAYMPAGLKFYTQIGTGAFIGAKLSKSDVIDLRQVLRPALILSVVMLCFTVVVAFLVCRISDLTIATALFAVAPAGITDMTLVSMDVADTQPSVVALMQTIRVIGIVCILPPVIRRLAGKYQFAGAEGTKHVSSAVEKSGLNLVLTLVIAWLGGLAGRAVGMPGGTLAFSMASCAGFNILFNKGFMPLRLRQFIQVFAGALIGCTIGREEFFQLIHLYKPVLLAIASFVILDFVATAIVVKWTDMDAVSALFACAPGGLTDMTLIAEEMGADSVKVVGIHTIRLVSVVAVYPMLIDWLVSWF